MSLTRVRWDLERHRSTATNDMMLLMMMKRTRLVRATVNNVYPMLGGVMTVTCEGSGKRHKLINSNIQM